MSPTVYFPHGSQRDPSNPRSQASSLSCTRPSWGPHCLWGLLNSLPGQQGPAPSPAPLLTPGHHLQPHRLPSSFLQTLPSPHGLRLPVFARDSLECSFLGEGLSEPQPKLGARASSVWAPLVTACCGSPAGVSPVETACGMRAGTTESWLILTEQLRSVRLHLHTMWNPHIKP